MEKELNQHEIDAMVQAARGGGPKERQVADWDYRKAGRLARDQLDAISAIHEGFARNLTNM